tara:strand:+ start:171 stop:1301 length:1131 start_codon:yes stop_codon:yes gene_type:complete
MKISRKKLRLFIEQALESVVVPIGAHGIKSITLSNTDFSLSSDDVDNFTKMYDIIVNASEQNESVVDEINFRTLLLEFILNVYTFDKDSSTKKSIIDFYENMRLRGYGISPFMIIGFITHIAKYIDYDIAQEIHEKEMKLLDIITDGALTKAANDLKNYALKNRELIIENLIKYLIPVSRRVDIIVDFIDGTILNSFLDPNSYNESLGYFRNLIPKFTEKAVATFTKEAAVGTTKKAIRPFPIQQIAWEYMREGHTVKITRAQLRKLILEVNVEGNDVQITPDGNISINKKVFKVSANAGFASAYKDVEITLTDVSFVDDGEGGESLLVQGDTIVKSVSDVIPPNKIREIVTNVESQSSMFKIQGKKALFTFTRLA